MRSKSEVLISDALYHYGIPYLYERPFCTDILRAPLFPDFTLYDVRTDREIFWEHFGMMDNIAYANKNIAKIQAYEQNGFLAGKNMIMTFESSVTPISSSTIKQMIEEYLL